MRVKIKKKGGVIINEAIGMLLFGGFALFCSVAYVLSMLSYAEGKTERSLSRLSFSFTVLPFAFNLLSVATVLFFFINVNVAHFGGEGLAWLSLLLLIVLTFLSATTVLPCAAAGIVYAVRRVRRVGKGRWQVALAVASTVISTLFLVIWLLILFEFA